MSVGRSLRNESRFGFCIKSMDKRLSVHPGYTLKARSISVNKKKLGNGGIRIKNAFVVYGTKISLKIQ